MSTFQRGIFLILLAYFSFYCHSPLSANKLSEEDSLLHEIKSFERINPTLHELTKEDTVYLNNLIGLSSIFIDKNNFQSAIRVSNIALKVAQQVGAEKTKAKIFTFLGISYIRMGDFSSSLSFFNAALKQYFKYKKLKNAANTYINICSVHRSLGNYPLAKGALYSALKIYELSNDSIGLAYVNRLFGDINSTMHSNERDALNYYYKSLKMFHNLHKMDEVGFLYNSIGILYGELRNYPKALTYLNAALIICTKNGDKIFLASVYNSIGEVYFKTSKTENALKNYTKALTLFEEIGDQNGVAYSNSGIGILLLSQGKMRQAALFLNKALKLSLEIGSKEYIKTSYKNLAAIDSMEHNWQLAYTHHKLYIQYRDSLQNEENTKKLVQTEMQYGFDKKQAADSIKVGAEKKVLGARIEQQKTQRNAFIAGFAVVLLLSGFIFRSYQQKQKANLLLEEKNSAILGQKEVIEDQKKTVEAKQKQIVASITYAKRIQQSILVPEQEIKKQLPESFVLYIPKDIVSGDFYWFSQQGADSIVVCADCTGHGVPGAFLSMVGSTLLNEIVQHKKITDPAQIMKELAKGVSSTLSNKAQEQSTSDGMDISICKINAEKVYFAAANNSLYIATKQGLQEIEPQVNSINGIFELHSEQLINSIELFPEKGAMLYLSTDGYADQPGESTKKKLFSTGFEKLLSEIHHLPVAEQKQTLESYFHEWKGALKQHDDILVMGVRV